MNFHEIRFPTKLSFGSAGGPERRTDVVELANGFEERNTPWAHSRRRYDAGLGMRSLVDVEALIAFFEARQGQLYGFRWKDWTDFKSSSLASDVSATDQVIGTGDGAQAQFTLCKTYSSGGASYTRPIKKPVAGSVQVAVAGVVQSDYSLDTSTGQITFASAPANGAEITAGFEFDVPVRFDTSSLNISVASFNAGDIPDVPIIEVRV